jgi:hypothetical protein
VDDPTISAHTMHLQLYTHNSLMRRALQRMGIGYLLEANTRLWDAFYGRLLITQGYLHSEDSSAIELTLKRGSGLKKNSLHLRGITSSSTFTKIKALLAKLKKLKNSLGAAPLAPLLKISLPGGGYHAGGTFPMRISPQAFESDVWGRPFGFKRIHAVDATVLPSIPATTITLSVMANAHRIGSQRE